MLAALVFAYEFDVQPSPTRARTPKLLTLRLTAMLPLLLLAGLAPAQTAVVTEAQLVPACPVGVLHCPKPADPYAKCKRNDLLDFYTPGLPAAGDRSKAATTADALKVTWTDRTHARLEGNAQMQRLDALLKSDFISYETETTDYVANGHVVYQDASTLMSADHARGTTTPNVTFLDNVRYQMLDQRGNGVAATANQSDPDHSKMTQATYSTCDPSERQWEMRSNDIEIDRVKNEGHGHGVTLAYEGVPFFWLPYMAWPIDDERHSGFLAPSLGYSDRRGFKVGIPYYLALAPNYDLTLKPTEYSERGPQLGGEFRYLSSWDRLLFDFTWMPHDDESTHDNRGYIRLQDWAAFSPNWGATVDIHHVSDVNYLKDFGDSFLTTAVALLNSGAAINGHGDWWSTSIGADTWQVTDPGLEPFCTTGGPLSKCAAAAVFKPYARLPHVTFNASKRIGGFDFGVDTEYVNFDRDYSITGQRVDIHPHIAYPIESAGWFVRPQLEFRYTGYDLSNFFFANNAQLNHTSPSRSLPILSVDSGLIFERDLKLFNTDLTQTLEPRLFYLYVPYRNQNDLPNFDTQLPSFDFPSLFRTNSFVGGDRQANANNLTLALTSRFLNSDTGDQILSASVGQIRYLDTIKVQLPGAPDLDITGRDIVGELDLRLGKNWDLTFEQQWNPHPKTFDPITGEYFESTHHTDLSSIGIQHRFGREGVVNLSYRFRRGFLEQLDGTALVPISDRWSLIARYYYSLQDSRLLEAFGGVQYDSCCVAARIVERRFINDVTYGLNNTLLNAKPTNVLFFEIEFKGIGSSGQRTENFLRRAMLGYQ